MRLLDRIRGRKTVWCGAGHEFQTRPGETEWRSPDMPYERFCGPEHLKQEYDKHLRVQELRRGLERRITFPTDTIPTLPTGTVPKLPGLADGPPVQHRPDV